MSKPEDDAFMKEVAAHIRKGQPLAEMIISPPVAVEVASDGGFRVYGLVAADDRSPGLPLLFHFPSEVAKILLANLRSPGNDPGAPEPTGGKPPAH